MKALRPASIVLMVSLVGLLLGALIIGLNVWQTQQEVQVETVGSRDLASLQAAASPSPSAAAGPWKAPVAVDHQAEEGYPIPVSVKIPTLDVSTDVLPVGLDSVGAMAIPEDISKVGWYDLGVAPGSYQGSAVLVAHRDGAEQGHGVFYSLGSLSVDDQVVVVNSAGEKLTYRVVSREMINKKGLPLEELFAIDGPPRLTLISCGGYYDRNNGGYQDNVVVTAVPDYRT